jgi:hypothetical protein
MAANGGAAAAAGGGVTTAMVPPTAVMPPEDYKGPVACSKESDKPGPRRLWRLSGEQYKNTVHVAFNGGPFAAGQKRPDLAFLRSSPFDLVAAGDRFSTNAASYNMNDAEFRKLFDQTEDAAVELVKKLRAGGSCLALKKPFAECAREIVKERGRLLYRRPLTDAELTQLTNVATGALAALGGNENEAMAAALQALLMSPHFVYRAELGAGTPDANGVVRLTSHEVAAPSSAR